MIGAVVLALFVLTVLVLIARDPDTSRWRARVERYLHAARRGRDVTELRRQIQRDAMRLRRELSEEFDRIDWDRYRR